MKTAEEWRVIWKDMTDRHELPMPHNKAVNVFYNLVKAIQLDASESLLNDVRYLRTEVDYRIEHGADSGKHLEYVRTCLDQIISAHQPKP